MYEMYPDVWTVTDRSAQVAAGQKPRRRARKEHSVVPAFIANQALRPQPGH